MPDQDRNSTEVSERLLVIVEGLYARAVTLEDLAVKSFTSGAMNSGAQLRTQAETCRREALDLVRLLVQHSNRQIAGQEGSITQRHMAHYRTCNCLGESAICCDESCPCHDEEAQVEAQIPQNQTEEQ